MSSLSHSWFSFFLFILFTSLSPVIHILLCRFHLFSKVPQRFPHLQSVPPSRTMIWSASSIEDNSLRNDDLCSIRNFLTECLTDQCVCFCVNRAGGIIQNQRSSVFSEALVQYRAAASVHRKHCFLPERSWVLYPAGNSLINPSA